MKLNLSKLQEKRQYFRDLMGDHNFNLTLFKMVHQRKVIIVGPSPFLEGKNMGSYIDSFDVIIRMNHGPKLVLSNPKDYGSRTDIVYLNQRLRKIWNKNLPYDLYSENEMKVINITFQNKNSLPTHQQFYGTWNNKDFKHRKYTLFDFASFLNYDFPPIMGNLALLEMLCLSPSKIEIVGCDFYQGLKENPDDFKSIWPSGYHGGKDPMLKSLSHKDTKYEHMDMFITIYLAINKGYRENTLHTQLVISDRLKEIINKRILIQNMEKPSINPDIKSSEIETLHKTPLRKILNPKLMRRYVKHRRRMDA